MQVKFHITNVRTQQTKYAEAMMYEKHLNDAVKYIGI